jgi:hypothetical protein
MTIEARRLYGQVHAGSNQAIVFVVIADPVPHDPILVHDAQCTILQTDANGIDVIFPFQLFEL